MRISNLNRLRGLTLLEVLLVVGILAALVLVVLPKFARAKSTSGSKYCVLNLRQFGIGVSVWTADNGDKLPWQISTNYYGGTSEWIGTSEAFRHFQALSNELSTPQVLVCPEDRKRTAATNFSTDFGNSHISYFLNLDAWTNPSSVLAGDHNLLLNGVAVKSGLLAWRSTQVLNWTDERHRGFGNILRADFSSDWVKTISFTNSGVSAAPMRLAIP